jgi:HK97 family phage major capsid protein
MSRLDQLRTWFEKTDQEWDGDEMPPEVAEAYVTNSRALRELEQQELAQLRAGAVYGGGSRNLPDMLTREQSFYDWAARRGMITRGSENLSFDRYLRGIATANWDGAEAERDLVEGTSTAGGVLVPTPLAANVIDKARNASRVFQAGAITVPMTSQTLKMPRLTVENAPTWHTENAAITAQDLTFDSVLFTAQTLVRTIKLSVELFEDSDPSAQGVIENSFARQIALELDRVALRGSGTPPEPKGVLNQTGITSTSHGANGSVIGTPPAAGTMGWEFLAQAVGLVRAQNFEPNAILEAPRTEQSLGLIRDTTEREVAPPRLLENIQRLTTNQIPITLTVGTSTDCSETYTGQWDQLMVGMRTEFNLQFLRERFLADTLEYAFVAYLRADIQLSQPKAFAVDLGVRS